MGCKLKQRVLTCFWHKAMVWDEQMSERIELQILGAVKWNASKMNCSTQCGKTQTRNQKSNAELAL